MTLRYGRSVKTLLASMPLLLWSPASAQPASDSRAAHGVQLLKWYSYYADRVPEPLPTIQLPGLPEDETMPSLRPKYDKASVPSGLAEFAAASFKKLRAAHTAQQRTALGKYKLTVARCTTAGEAVLVTVSPARNEICVSQILLTSIFLESAGTDVLRLRDHLVGLGVSMSSFTGAYDNRLNQRGVTRADWDGMLGANEDVWSSLRDSTDYLFAYLFHCYVLVPGANGCRGDALKAVSRSGGLDLKALGGALASARESYDPASWAFARSGDASDVQGDFAQAARDAARPR